MGRRARSVTRRAGGGKRGERQEVKLAPDWQSGGKPAEVIDREGCSVIVIHEPSAFAFRFAL